MKILNAIVFYNNYFEVKNYIDEVQKISEGIVDIIVVVNSDPEGKIEELKRDIKPIKKMDVSIINYGENVGYLNTLLKPVKDINLELYDYYILSNTDINYPDPDFFEKLSHNEYQDDIGCIAPDVYNPTRRIHSNPHYKERIPREQIERLIKIFRYPTLGKWYLKLSGLKNKNKKLDKKESCYVYSPHGCYMIFSRKFIEAIKDYTYGVTLYSEESAIGELLCRYHFKCYYDDSIFVIHEASTVTGKINYKKRFSAWRESLEYILKEFY